MGDVCPLRRTYPVPWRRIACSPAAPCNSFMDIVGGRSAALTSRTAILRLLSSRYEMFQSGAGERFCVTCSEIIPSSSSLFPMPTSSLGLSRTPNTTHPPERFANAAIVLRDFRSVASVRSLLNSKSPDSLAVMRVVPSLMTGCNRSLTVSSFKPAPASFE